ncbi:MAG: response regulator transcription factor [Eubacterium sp.]|jgi:DNA-binding response OmpR family regulator|nr:response regulator transcription factor [Eubacterium sp.]
MRLLLVEDDCALQTIITKRLKSEGYKVDSCSDGENGYDYASALEYDCIILDIMLPKLSGLNVLKKLRDEGNKSNVLILTAKDSIEDRVAGLDAGADDYLVKPFAFEELLARIRTLMRRQSENRDNLLSYYDLEMNINEHTVMRSGEKINLTSKEYALLEYLIRNQGRALTRSQISDHVWNNEFEYDSNIVDVYIRYLRNKIDKKHKNKLIQTIRGTGYALRVEK